MQQLALGKPVIVACTCGASYERRDIPLPVKDIGVFECAACGARLAAWSGRVVPVFVRTVKSGRNENGP